MGLIKREFRKFYSVQEHIPQTFKKRFRNNFEYDFISEIFSFTDGHIWISSLFFSFLLNRLYKKSDCLRTDALREYWETALEQKQKQPKQQHKHKNHNQHTFKNQFRSFPYDFTKNSNILSKSNRSFPYDFT